MLCLVDHLAGGGPAQVCSVLGTDHPHPDLTDRGCHWHPRLTERAVQPQMNVHDRAEPTTVGLVMVEEMLAPRRRAAQHQSVDQHRVSEPALRARDRHPGTAEPALMQPGQPMQGMTLGHGSVPGR